MRLPAEAGVHCLPPSLKRERASDRVAMLAGLADAPETASPLDMLADAFRSAEGLLTENRGSADLRREVVAATPALQERALAKTEMLVAELAAALRQRGVEPRVAMLAARVGMVAGADAIASWGEDASLSFAHHLERTFSEAGHALPRILASG